MEEHTTTLKGRILSIQNDDLYNTGILILTEDGFDGEDREYSQVENCQLRNFTEKILINRKGSILPGVHDFK